MMRTIFQQFFRHCRPTKKKARLLLCAVLLGSFGMLIATSGDAAEDVQSPVAEQQAAVAGNPTTGRSTEKLTINAPRIFMIAGLPVTNSMITGWLSAAFLVLASVRFRQQLRAGRNTKFTVAVESLVIAMDDLLVDIMGKKLARQTFWLLGSFFIFIFFSNLLGLFPGVGSIGWGHPAGAMFQVTQPLFRNVNADLNTTMALAALFFLFWFIWAWKERGPLGILKYIFGAEGDMQGAMRIAMVVVFFAAGFLELLSIFIRPFALAVRLYGNMFAGEVMLGTMLHKIPALAWLLPVPFYLMEVLVALIQALVFALLSAVFIMLICGREETEEYAGHEMVPNRQEH
ncbi:MAG: F-type H+-transporting ATPase subunit a [Verrucomicrobiota bacterium]|jgi:F-type H+-transporting ATPase subunit a|nr:F-type H+-transporting ATPase subunit a [Verrucomicrobiota bacterium]MDK2963135.1 F-type H+-transporting ATPase subunit a [Verrucomicrobiota bacterium]